MRVYISQLLAQQLCILTPLELFRVTFLKHFCYYFYWYVLKPLLLVLQFEITPPNCPCKALHGWRSLNKHLHNKHQCKEFIHLYTHKCDLLHYCLSAPQSPWPSSPAPHAFEKDVISHYQVAAVLSRSILLTCQD